MKLLFMGANNCNRITFKRLLIIADKIAFISRPSIGFENWGTIGADSSYSKYIPRFRDKPVKIGVITLSSGQVKDLDSLYLNYILSDLNNPQFRHLLIKGIISNEKFSRKLINPNGSYGKLKGSDVISNIAECQELYSLQINELKLEGTPYNFQDKASQRDTLKMLIAEASIHLTNSMIASLDSDFIPVADDPVFPRLLASRLVEQKYQDGISTIAPLLGLEITKTIIPEEILQKIDIDAILEYRERTEDAYKAWATELNSLSAEIDKLPTNEISNEIPRLIAKKVSPRLIEYHNEMKTVRDKLFGNMIKTVTEWEFATLSVSYLSGLNWSEIIIAFIGALMPAIPGLVDYFQEKRDIQRRNSFAYMIGLKNELK